MDHVIDVVKHGKRESELFAVQKLHDSIVASCRSLKSPEAVAKHAAEQVCAVVIAWAADKPEITSDDIRRQASHALERYHPEAAYIYQHHNVIM
jgi:CTP:molybdopterin cytidylyltransferase MocA